MEEDGGGDGDDDDDDDDDNDDDDNYGKSLGEEETDAYSESWYGALRH